MYCRYVYLIFLFTATTTNVYCGNLNSSEQWSDISGSNNKNVIPLRVPNCASQTRSAEVKENIKQIDTKGRLETPLHPDLGSLPKNIEEEKDPYKYAFGKTQRFREAQQKFDSEMGTTKVIHFNENSEFSKLAEKLGNQFLHQCNNKSDFLNIEGGSGVGITADERYTYWATFAQISFGQIGLTENEELTDKVQQSFMERVFSEIKNLSMDTASTEGDMIMKKVEEVSLPDPKLDFICPGENFMLLRQTITACDMYAMIKLENEGLGVGIVYNTKKIVIVLLHYFPLHGSPVYSWEHREFMKKLAAISSNKERSPFYKNTLHEVAREILTKTKPVDEFPTNPSEEPQFKIAIQRRYFLVYTSIKILPEENVGMHLDMVLKKIISLSNDQDKGVLNTELRYGVDDDVLRNLDVQEENYTLPVKMGLGIRKMLTTPNYGTGVEVSVKDDVMTLLLVTFPSAQFFFNDGYRKLGEIRSQVLPGWGLNLLHTAKLGCLAQDVVTLTQEVNFSNISKDSGNSSSVGGFCVNEDFTASFQYFPLGETGVVDEEFISSKVDEFVISIGNQKINEGQAILPSLEDNPGAIPWTTVTRGDVILTYIRNKRSLADIVAITSDSTNGINIHVKIIKNSLLVIIAHGRDKNCGMWDNLVIERELLALKYIKSNPSISEIARITSAIHFTKEEIMYRLMCGYVKNQATSTPQERAQSLADRLLREGLDRGIGFDQVGTDTFGTIFVRPESVPGVSYSRSQDTHQDAMNINAVRDVLDILCSGILGINGPRKKALEETPHYYNPDFPEGENEHVIMRKCLHIADLGNLLSTNGAVKIGVGRIVIPDINRPADTPTFYMVAFLLPHQRNLTGSNEGLGERYLKSSLCEYCRHLLASQLAASILQLVALKKDEGFGTASGCIVRYKKFMAKRDVSLVNEFEQCESAVKCYSPSKPIVDFKFKFNEQDVIQTFLPFKDVEKACNLETPEPSRQVQTATGIAKEHNAKGAELTVIVAVRLHSRKLKGDRLMYINELRRFSGSDKLYENSPAAVAMSIIGQSVARTEFAKQLKYNKAFSHANELAAIFRRVETQSNEPVNTATALSDVIDELMYIKNEDGTPKCLHTVDTLPTALTLEEGTLISDQTNNIRSLPIWKQDSVWDVLNITSSVTKEMGYWVDETKRYDGTIVVIILFYCPNTFATTSTYKELEKFRNSNKNLLEDAFISPMLTHSAQVLAKKIGFNLTPHPVLFSGGFGLGATFKATFHVWKDFEDVRNRVSTIQLTSAFRTLLNPERVSSDIPNIFHSLTDFSWAAESDKSRTFTPAAFGRIQGDLLHVKNAKIEHFGIYFYQYEGHLIVAILTPLKRNLLINNHIFENLNNIRNASGIPPLSRTSSLAALVDIFANDVASKLPLGDKQFGVEGLGTGKDCLVYYKQVEVTENSTTETDQKHLQDFVEQLLTDSVKMAHRNGIMHNMDYNTDLRPEWYWSSNGSIRELPMWRKRANSKSDTLPILSRKTREAGMSFFRKKTPDGKKTFLVLVFVLYTPSPYLENSTLNRVNLFPSSMLSCMADTTADALVRYSSLEEGIGVGPGFAAAFKRIQLPPASHFDNKAVEEMNKFLTETLTSTSSKKLIEMIEINPDFKFEGSKETAEESKHKQADSEPPSFPFIPISSEISVSQIKRMVADARNKGLGLSVGINRPINQLMLLILSPWTNKLPNVDESIEKLNRHRLAGTKFKRVSPVSAALEFLATDIGFDHPNLSGYYHKGADLAWSIVNLGEMKSITPVATDPIEYILSKKQEINCSKPTTPDGWVYNQEACLSSNITFMDFIQSAWPTTKYAGVGGTAENLVVVYYTKTGENVNEENIGLNGPYEATNDIFIKSVKNTACSEQKLLG